MQSIFALAAAPADFLPVIMPVEIPNLRKSSSPIPSTALNPLTSAGLSPGLGKKYSFPSVSTPSTSMRRSLIFPARAETFLFFIFLILAKSPQASGGNYGFVLKTDLPGKFSYFVIARSEAMMQSIICIKEFIDCFAQTTGSQ